MDTFITHLAAAGRSAGTQRLRRYHLTRFACFLDGRDITSATLEDVEAFMSCEGWTLDYRRSVRTSLRLFFRWLQASGRREDDPTVVLAPVRPSPPRPRPTPSRALDAALRAADEAETMMIRLAAEAGLRRGEVAVVHSRDLVDDLTGVSLLVHGKGGKDRLIPLSDDLGAVLRARMGARPGFLFPGSVGGHISPAWVGKRVSRLLPAGVTMHSLRHYFATGTYHRSRDLLAVQQLLGHSSPAITQLYVEVDQTRLRAALAA